MKEMYRSLILVVVCTLVSALPMDHTQQAEACGYASCTQHEPDVLNVHIVPHSHDDVGWLKTVDQYYYGNKNGIQNAGVQYILDTVVRELWEDPKRRFIYVESFFFFKWWNRQTEEVKDKVRTLVSQGRLQFTGGAWSMNDEAAAHYHSTVDQFTHGLSKLNSTFGPCGVPRVGWQIDPFGHSRELAALLSAMGYDGLFLGRIDYQDKHQRLTKKTMEMLWRGDDTIGKPSDIFTGVLYNTYSPPAGFCFDIMCSDEPIIDDTHSPDYNVEKRVSKFLDVVNTMSDSYLTNNVLVTMGDDFQYQDARHWFANLDKLIQYTNLKAGKDNLKIKLFYSTPQCYLKAVKDSHSTFPTKQDDFFPYASDSHAYWTGYFTSRPTTKYFERLANTYLQMAKHLQVLGNLKESNMFVLNELKSAMGIMQHHDAITGTEKQHVAHDYERILNNAIEDVLVIPREAFSKFMQGDSTAALQLSFAACRLNESSCSESENTNAFVVTVYNHLAWNLNESVRIPVLEGDYDVYCPMGQKISSQIVPISNAVTKIPTRVSKATHEVVFIAKLHPLSYKNFYVRKVQNEKRSRREGRSKKRVDHQGVYNVNEYWKKIKEEPIVEIKNLEAEPLKDVKSVVLNENDRIPDRPVYNSVSGSNTYNYETLNVDVMKDSNFNRDSEELARILQESRRLLHEARANLRRSKAEASMTHLNDEEMRMLSDDPLVVSRPADSFWEAEDMKLSFNPATGEMFVTTKPNGYTTKLEIRYGYYIGMEGNNQNATARASGAYILRPTKDQPENINVQFNEGSTGKIVKEVNLQTDKNIASTVRLYDGLNFIENDWVVGPIDITDRTGKEYVVNYVTSIINNGEFYTDSNGRQLLKRKLGKRPQYNVSIAEPVAGNYYPITNQIVIQNDDVRFSVLTDRSEGGSSLQEGHIELMLHRRLLCDDAFGVGEALNETVLNGIGLVVRGRHRLFLGGNVESRVKEKKLVKQFDLQPQIFVSDAKDLALNDWLKLKNGFSFAKELPEGLHLLTLEPWGDKLLIRLENYLDVTDRPRTSIVVDLNDIFKTININSFKETTLAANRWIDETDHWSWNVGNSFSNNDIEADKNNDEGLKIEIKPKQIRTFVVEYEFK